MKTRSTLDASWTRLVLAFAALSVGVLGMAPAALAISSRTLIAPTGEAPSYLGASVSAAGDVNGDGYGDVIVGAFAYNNYTGRAYVYYGGPGADTVADLTLTGEASIDQFGISVSAAGDFNGDGYGDVIVGANGYSGFTGRAYVYYGGPGADTVPDITLTGGTSNNYFGYSVSSAGDVNGDGYGDVIVGAYSYSNGTGRAYVYYGGPGADNVADLTLTGEASSTSFGYSVSAAGDVNGDGYGDLIVGANGYSSQTGRAYVYYGGPSADTVADLTLTGGASFDRFGGSVSAAGDVNGDGFADVIVGAYGYSSETGRAYVYYGGPGADTVADLTLTGVVPGNQFGKSVSTVDVNADGYGDVMVGAPLYSSSTGRAYVYYGGPGADTVADLTLTGEASNTAFGYSVSAAGDVNGDGHGDIIVGAVGYVNNTGRAYVKLVYPYEVLAPNGGEAWVAGHQAIVHWRGHDVADIGFSPDGGLSWSTIAAGVGGGEDNEVEVTVPDAVTATGKVRVVYAGQAATRATSDASDRVFRIVPPMDPPEAAARLALTLTGGAGEISEFGYSVSAAGDVNGDGYGDVIVGAEGYNNYTGRAYVYYGGPGADTVADLTLTGEALNDYFGASVSAAGDVNGDGYGDVIVGAYQYGGNTGRAYVYYGGPGADAVADLTLTGEAANNYFGASVSGAGDMNGDGYGDVVVGAFASNGTGRAYVYYGGPVANAVADLTLTGEAMSNQFGVSVSAAGDVNGDGYGDVIVGANGYNFYTGRAYLYYGGPAPDTMADLTLTGEAKSTQFGGSVSAAGDVNGDGYGDVVVGAAAYSNATGRAYVYYGGPWTDTVADLTLTGEASFDRFGASVSGAGDVNGDRHADVIVGAWGYNGNTGRVYVYYGGPGADTVADLALTGGASYDAFGSSVSAVGDVKRDGYGDVIVGAPGYGNYTGRAYVYDFNRYHVTSPNGGETWNVGAMKTISWLGAEPADVWLSVDGGNTHELIESGVGGQATNVLTLRVPHTPTKFARIKVTPSNTSIEGFDRSDSVFTIQTSVSLLAMLAAPLPQGGASISWSTDPGPADLSGYRLERATAAGASTDWQTVVALTQETTIVDPTGGPGSRYRLFAMNGFNEALWLGEASLPQAKPLAAWPLPYRGGSLSISFATAGGLGVGGAKTRVEIYDLQGRLVRRIASGAFSQGYRTEGWDGRDGQGRDVASGVYFLRSTSGGEVRTLRLAVLR